MKTFIVLRGQTNDRRTVKFISHNTPPLLTGDTFRLSIFGGMDPAEVTGRQWVGQDLYFFCRANPMLLCRLIEKAEMLKLGRIPDYELPDQDFVCKED